MSSHRALIEGLYPAFIGSSKLNQKWTVRTNRNQFLSLKSETLATMIIPFEHLDALVQIGTDITSTKPLYILAVGRKAGSSI